MFRAPRMDVVLMVVVLVLTVLVDVITAVAVGVVLAIDLLDVPRIDGSAAIALEEIIERASDAGKPVLLIGLSAEVGRLLSRMGMLDRLQETARFATRRGALQAAVDMLGAGPTQ